MFDYAGAAASISVDIVSIVTVRYKSLAVSTDFLAESVVGWKVKAETARIARIAVGATRTSSGAGKASELLLVPVSSSGARYHGGNRVDGVDGVNWVDRVDWLNDALGSIPDLSSSAGNTLGSIKV